MFEQVFERVAGLDVHKAQVTACMRVPDAEGRRVAHLAEFATTVAGLLALADWLKGYGVAHVAMEATGVYWLPVWLAHSRRRLRVDVVQRAARQERPRAQD
ncbi:MAG: transposase [Solirubrobacteraceae bacterium]